MEGNKDDDDLSYYLLSEELMSLFANFTPLKISLDESYPDINGSFVFYPNMAALSEIKQCFATLNDGKSKPQAIQLQLTAEVLILMREELIPVGHEENTNEILNKLRTIVIHKEEFGGLGLSVKGGAEHRLPVLISRIIPDQAAAKTEQLFVGDAILKVNDQSVELCTHDEVVDILKNAGDVVTLTVRHFKPASIFLNKGADNSDQLPSASNPPGINLPRLEKQWVIYSSIPLLFAYLTRYFPGTDKLRTSAFEVVGMDGASTGVIQMDDSHMFAEWITLITNNISALLNQMIRMMNRLLLPEEQIMYMGWVQERVFPGHHKQAWKFKFVALKGPEVFFFDLPPMQTRDWVRCDTVFRVYECMFKVLQDSELLDDRQHCCTIQTGSKETMYFSLESRSDLLHLEKAWYRTNHTSVMQLKSHTFGCTWRGRLSGLTLDLDVGFSLYDSETKTYQWSYKFSKLKSSSDDGKSKLKLSFQSENAGQVEIREIQCTNLQALLFCMHAFLSAKLASVDPSFLTNF